MKISFSRLAKVLAQLLIAAPSIIEAIKPVVRSTKGKGENPSIQGEAAGRAQPIPEPTAPD